ncbi:MAG: DUF6807 family protein [Planctomycetota bacterium]|jgi:hypothetical protein
MANLKIIGLLALLFLAGGCSQSVEFHATIRAGNSRRTDTPVFVETNLPRNLAQGSACVVYDNRIEPAQIEDLGQGRARVWWIISDLPPNHSQTYTIKVGPAKEYESKVTFAWTDSSANEDKSTELLFGNCPVLRYMYTPFDNRDIERTKKPYHHVFDPDGSQLITKGAGGKFSHHRGIFFGYRKTRVDGQEYDTWHCGKGEHQLHKEVLQEITGPVMGGQVLQINWNDRKGKPIIEEIRRIIVFRQSKDHLLIDFTSTLSPVAGPVNLSGDRQHAGVQFRASQEVAENEKETRYLRPAKCAHLPTDQQINTPEHKDLPWNAMQYKLGNRAYTVAYLSDPKNPDGADFSERLYGRFGEYFPWQLTKDNPLTVHYRWWISATGTSTREQIVQRYDDVVNPPEAAIEQNPEVKN